MSEKCEESVSRCKGFVSLAANPETEKDPEHHKTRLQVDHRFGRRLCGCGVADWTTPRSSADSVRNDTGDSSSTLEWFHRDGKLQH